MSSASSHKKPKIIRYNYIPNFRKILRGESNIHVAQEQSLKLSAQNSVNQ